MATLPTTRPTRPAPRFLDSWQNLLRITTVRVISQAVTFGLFVTFVVLTTFADLQRWPALRQWVSKALEVDPLLALGTALSTHTVYGGLVWCLAILIPTLLLGRFFCGWICPYGTSHQFVRWLLGTGSKSDEPNRFRPAQRTKYYLLIALLLAAVLGTLQIGLLDPLCLAYRSFAGAVIPTLHNTAPDWLGGPRFQQGAGLIGGLLLGLLAMNLVWPRFFCRVLCPLGALLGVLSRYAWWRIERDLQVCRGCDRCRVHCEGACEPQAQLRKAECLVCFNCIEECPEHALRFARLPPPEHEVTGPDLTRRKMVFAGLSGLLFYPLSRADGRTTRDFSSEVIRPPGAREELDFLARCVKCAQCLRVCPTNVIQPAWFEAGLEGLWTPVLNFRIGHCQLHCAACGQVCPTGALRRITVDEKLGQGEHATRGPMRLGTAHIDVGRCLPHSAAIACQVCQEVCPTSPKAISMVPNEPRPVPRVHVDLCIGCGLCERECPVVGDRRAIRVTAAGETRSQYRPERDRNRSIRLPGAAATGE